MPIYSSRLPKRSSQPQSRSGQKSGQTLPPTRPFVDSITNLQRVAAAPNDRNLLPVQRKISGVETATDDKFEQQLNQARGGGHQLEPTVRTKMESAIGADFTQVKIHTDARADQLSRSIQAKAFTTGKDVFFRQGEYNPTSRSGQALMAHELTHVVQQAGSSQDKSDHGLSAPSTAVQRVIEGPDPIADSNLLDEQYVNDLLYGIESYRGATRDRIPMGNTPVDEQPKRTIDKYNASVGIDGGLFNRFYSYEGLYKVRNALENPSNWGTWLTTTTVAYPDNNQVNAHFASNGQDGNLSNEQKWMTFLVRARHQIGLWDLSDSERAVIKKRVFKKDKKEEKGISKIKDKNRFEKNTNNDDVGKFSVEDVYKMLSFGTDLAAATQYYQSLSIDIQEGVSRWIANAFWRRTSKLGLDFATSETGLNARVHFNLTSGVRENDGSWTANLWGILNDVAADQGTRRITESEWRYVQKMLENDPERAQRIIPYSEHR